MSSLSAHERELLQRLDEILARARRSGPRVLARADVADLMRLYRHACSVLARLEASGGYAGLLGEVRRVVGAAHALLHRETPRQGHVARVLAFFLAECPRAIRAEWRLVSCSLAVFYGLAAGAWALVAHDFELAYSLFDAEHVRAQVSQLESTPPGELFRGNFDFGLGESPATAGMIMAHNMGIGVLVFAASLIPPLYALLIALNGLMLGTYTGVAWHWGQAGSISSILWCHGALELQAIVLAGTAGLVLVRAWIAPGAWSRRHAMRRASERAWRLFAPVFPMLFVAGSIEGFVSPHAPRDLRLAVALASGVALLAWVLLGGRARTAHAVA